MYKAKSASMMRGAETRAKLSPKTRAVFGNARTPARPNLNAKITVGELIQFNSATTSREAFLAQLRPAIQQARRAGYSTPLQITTFLNRNGWRTACDERWDERLTVLLLRLLSSKSKPVQQPKPPLPASSVDPGLPREGPLTREEIARRLTAMGRVTGNPRTSEKA